MPPVNGQWLRTARVEYRLLFRGAFNAAAPEYRVFTNEDTVDSGGDVTIGWAGAPPMMRKWVGDAVLDQIDLYKWELAIDKYQAGFTIKREDIVDDKLNLIRPHVKTLGEEAAQAPGRQAFDLLNNGDATLCYDGQYFFDTDHKDADGPVLSNKITGVLNQANLQAMRTLFGRYKDTKGRAAPRRLTHLGVPPELEGAARELRDKEEIGGANNMVRGSFEIIVSPYFSSAVKWFGFDLSNAAYKPVNLMWREKPELVAQERADDEEAFMRQQFRYNAWGRWGVGFGPWQFAAMSTGV